MPKQKGFIKIIGTLNGTCYYSLHGAYISRVANGPSKKQIQTDPTFALVKANNLEFGMASKLSKTIRTGFLETAKQFQDSYMASRLSGVCRKIIQKGQGPIGKREAHLKNNPQAIIGFQLNKQVEFKQVYTAKIVVKSRNSRSLITLSIPKSNILHLNKQPKKATHFQLIGALSLVSKYTYVPSRKAYHPKSLKQNAIGVSQKTAPLICKADHKNLQINLQAPVTSPIKTNVSIAVWFGIQYLKYEESQWYVYKNPKTMSCIALF